MELRHVCFCREQSFKLIVFNYDSNNLVCDNNKMIVVKEPEDALVPKASSKVASLNEKLSSLVSDCN